MPDSAIPQKPPLYNAAQRLSSTMRLQGTGAVVTARAYAVAFPRAMREPLIADVSLRIIRLIQTLPQFQYERTIQF